MPARSFEEILQPYRGYLADESSYTHNQRVEFLTIYFWACFAPENTPWLTHGERFDPDQMKQGLSRLDLELKRPRPIVVFIGAVPILTWICQVWYYIRDREPNNQGLLEPLLNLLSKTDLPVEYKDKKRPLSGLVARPGESIDIQDIYRLSQLRSSVKGNHLWGVQNSLSKFTYITLLNLLGAKYNNGQSYRNEEVTKRNLVLQRLIFDNPDLFEPYNGIISFYQLNEEWKNWKNWPLLLQSPSTESIDYRWIEKLLTIPENFKRQLFWLWRKKQSTQGPINYDLFEYELFYPGRITKENLIAIYAVGAAYVKFDTTLFLYLFPEDGPIVSEFWKQYGESITLLQELYDAYVEWSQAIRNNQVPTFLASSQICNRLATRMVDETILDRLRYQFVDLGEKSMAQEVPLKLLFKNMPIDSLDIANKEGLFELLRKNTMLTSSLWYFDYLRTWWDAICKSTLESRLRELIVESMPGELKQQNYEADQLLADSLRQIAMYGPRAAGSQVRHRIRHASLPRDMRRSLLDTINTLTNNESAMSQLSYLGEAVQTGVMSQGIADMELLDYIDRWRHA